MPRAAICTAVGEPIEVADVDLKPPQAGEVRVRLGASGVCHSDLSIQNGTLLVPTPLVLGHEGAGVIEEVGDGVDTVQKGDHVVISWVPQCGECFTGSSVTATTSARWRHRGRSPRRRSSPRRAR